MMQLIVKAGIFSGPMKSCSSHDSLTWLHIFPHLLLNQTVWLRPISVIRITHHIMSCRPAQTSVISFRIKAFLKDLL